VNKNDFLDIVDWEGGVFETLFNHGITPSEIEDEKIRTLVEKAYVIYSYLEPIMNKFDDLRYDDV
jgi:hypothetical protein